MMEQPAISAVCGAPWFESGKSLLAPIRGGHKERERRLGRRFGRWNRNRVGNSSMSRRRWRSGNVGAH